MRYCGELIRNADGAAATPEDRGKEHFVIARVSVLIDEPSFKARALTSDHHLILECEFSECTLYSPLVHKP